MCASPPLTRGGTQTGGWPPWALRVGECESGGDALAYNPAGPYVGWWQVLNGSFDPYENTAQAHRQFVEWQQGLRGNPWGYCGRVA